MYVIKVKERASKLSLEGVPRLVAKRLGARLLAIYPPYRKNSASAADIEAHILQIIAAIEPTLQISVQSAQQTYEFDDVEVVAAEA
jgi:hypothetical protein